MEGSRRAVLVAGVAATAGLATGTAQTVPQEHPPPAPADRIRFNRSCRIAAADDFGHVVHEVPIGVLMAESVDDVAATIRLVAEQRWRFAARGCGHSVYGRSMASEGIIGDMSRLRAVHLVDSDRIVVDAGATWREVLAATLPRGLAPPVLTDYLDRSIGGTLVVGGVGATTSRHGVQSDNVASMEVVTGTGRKLSCSPSVHADLFDAVRAGLGQVGVITRRP